MKNNNFINELDDKEIEMMLKYVPEYTQDNARNIRNKFERKAKLTQKKLTFRKFALGGVAASIILVSTLTYAEIIDISKIYKTIFGGNSKYLEQYIEPLDEEKGGNLSIQSEYDGIIIELISAVNDENALRIFATITDTKGDRLSKDLDFTHWGLNMGHGGNASIVDYNNETKTATMLITSLGNEHKGKATLKLNGFSTGRELLENLPEDHINIGELLKGHRPEIIHQNEIWKSGGGGENDKIYEESRLLKPNEMDVKFDNVDMFSISNIGFVDGLFHIQMKAMLEGAALVDGYYINAKLVNADKEIIYDSISMINFINDKKYAYEINREKPHEEYTEIIYEDIISPDQIKDLSLVIDYMKSPKITEGNWELSFMVPEKITTEFGVNRDISINDEKLRIDTISLSPIGITVHLPKNISKDYSYTDTVSIKYNNGSTVKLDQVSIHTYENESTLIFGGDIIEIENVESIIINGEEINISQ